MVEIRKAHSSDLALIAKMYFKEMAPQFKKIGEPPISSKKYLGILRKNYSSSHMYVMKEDSDILGFLWFNQFHEIDLEEIFVVRKHQGLGKLLIRFLLDKAKGRKIKKINADVHFKNTSAIKFFKSQGFTERTVELSLGL